MSSKTILILIFFLFGIISCQWHHIYLLLAPEDVTFINYASPEHGAEVTTNYEEPQHPVSTVINGVKDSNLWDEGEGWCSGTALKYRQIGEEIEIYGRSWSYEEVYVEIKFPKIRKIKKIIVYTLDSEKYPNRVYGINAYTIKYYTNNNWQNLTSVTNNTKPIIIHEFKPIETDRIRLVTDIRNAKDFSEDFKGYDEYQSVRWYNIKGNIRIIEIEVFGY